jgi:hypothetical protein
MYDKIIKILFNNFVQTHVEKKYAWNYAVIKHIFHLANIKKIKNINYVNIHEQLR